MAATCVIEADFWRNPFFNAVAVFVDTKIAAFTDAVFVDKTIAVIIDSVAVLWHRDTGKLASSFVANHAVVTKSAFSAAAVVTTKLAFALWLTVHTNAKIACFVLGAKATKSSAGIIAAYLCIALGHTISFEALSQSTLAALFTASAKPAATVCTTGFTRAIRYADLAITLRANLAIIANAAKSTASIGATRFARATRYALADFTLVFFAVTAALASST